MATPSVKTKSSVGEKQSTSKPDDKPSFERQVTVTWTPEGRVQVNMIGVHGMSRKHVTRGQHYMDRALMLFRRQLRTEDEPAGGFDHVW